MIVDSTIDVLIIGAIMAVAAVAQTMVTGRQAEKRQENDWKRQDVVKERAEDTARLLVVSNQKIADQVAIATREAAKAAAKTLDVATTTHALVNSNFTEVKMALLAMAELVVSPVPLSQDKREEVEKLIRSLRVELDERARKLANLSKEDP